MNYDEAYSRENFGSTHGIGDMQVRKVMQKEECIQCHKETHFHSTMLGLPVCSEECLDNVWYEMWWEH